MQGQPVQRPHHGKDLVVQVWTETLYRQYKSRWLEWQTESGGIGPGYELPEASMEFYENHIGGYTSA